MYDPNELITIPELTRRLKRRKKDVYLLIETPGFPLVNIGGERGNRVVWGDALDWIKANLKAS